MVESALSLTLYSASLLAIHSNNQKQIIQIEHNRIKNPNWQEATIWRCTSVAKILNSGQPRTNPNPIHPRAACSRPCGSTSFLPLETSSGKKRKRKVKVKTAVSLLNPKTISKFYFLHKPELCKLSSLQHDSDQLFIARQ